MISLHTLSNSSSGVQKLICEMLFLGIVRAVPQNLSDCLAHEMDADIQIRRLIRAIPQIKY